MSIVESHKNYDPRLRVFYYMMGAMILLLLLGLARLQLFDNAEYSEKEKRQNQRRVLFPGPRGNIFDREGRLLVGNRPRFSAVIYLAELRAEFREEYLTLIRQYREAGKDFDWREVKIDSRSAVVQRYLDEINQITGREQTVDSQELDRHFRQRLLLPYPLSSDLKPREFARILEQVPLGSKVQLLTASARYYPHGSAASHVLGYVSSTPNVPDNDLPGENLMTFNIPGSIGKSGLEKAWNERLQGKTGAEIWVVDPSGFRYGRPIERHQPVQGEDIVTSIDLDLQKIAESALGRRTGAAVALDIETGEVLAMASKPDYDLNDLTPYIPQKTFDRIEEDGAWLNRPLQGAYPPGSTFKLISAMGMLRKGTITPETTSYCGGSFRVGRSSFPCHNRVGHGDVTLADALRVSCNVFFYEHGLEAGIETIANEARRFGLDKKTGIELSFETGRMNVPDREYKRRVWNEPWYSGDTANVSIGQGFLLSTPLQMAAFTASLARGETLTKPTLLRRSSGLSPIQQGSPIGLPPGGMDAVLAGMEAAVENGTARFARLPNVSLAGKTGTAQVRTAEGTLHLAWFLGFAPIENPKIAVAIMLEGTQVQDNYAGGTTAAPVAREIFQLYFEKNPPPPPPDLAEFEIRK